MKKSKKPTGQILIKAGVCSEWDCCNSCLVEFNQRDIDRWKFYDTAATKLKQETTFHCLIIWEFSDFLNISIEDSIPECWHYVIAKEDEFTNKQRPEQRIDAHQIKFYGEGRVCFIGYGKHTSEEFWTETIDINELNVSV